MRSSCFVAFACLAAGCGSGAPAHQQVQLESLGFDVPADWQRSDWKQRGVSTSSWAPEDNERKESISIVRSERSPAVAQADSATLQQLLTLSQRSLTQVRATAATPVRTSNGLCGARVEVDFVPRGRSERYHRVHVVLADGNVLVHVMYTSRSPDPDLEALSTVLDTIHHEEG